MKRVLYLADPLRKEDLTLALEAGVDGIIAARQDLDLVGSLARIEALDLADLAFFSLNSKQDEDLAAASLLEGRLTVLRQGWQVIPVENLLAREQVGGQRGLLALEADSPDQARLALGILEQGVDNLVITAAGLAEIRNILDLARSGQRGLDLCAAEIVEIRQVGLGHRVCVDTLSLCRRGQGLLVGNSAAFTFLVNAETEPNPYVAARPFRINAGAVHAYAIMPDDRTNYLEELRSGDQVLLVDHTGRASTAVVGRLKTEVRPMLMLKARAADREGTLFVQNAETVRLVGPDGQTPSVVSLRPGDKVLCKLDVAGRHFGLRVTEEISE